MRTMQRVVSNFFILSDLFRFLHVHCCKDTKKKEVMGVIDVKEIKGHVFFSKKLVSGLRE
jgi:hypothetical protein